eukprot:502673_1
MADTAADGDVIVIDSGNDDDDSKDEFLECMEADVKSLVPHNYTKIYGILKDLEQYTKDLSGNVKISIPEFLFLGFQSSGKTSAVSQAAKIPVGIMKNGTASRCPMRFKLVNNPTQTEPLIKVNGIECKNQQELTLKCMQITEQLEKDDKFTNIIIEVRIESKDVADLTFVDLPGLITSPDEKWKEIKPQLDQMTADFLEEHNPDGSYRYIPIVVIAAQDAEHDKKAEVNHIDGLVTQRLSWQTEALFIINKFDLQINRAPASKLIEYIKHCRRLGQSVITMMNTKEGNPATMQYNELSAFVANVSRNEKSKWKDAFDGFAKLNDEDLSTLKQLVSEVCGVDKMNDILSQKMVDIVTKILPSIQNKLKLAEKEKQKHISDLIKQIALCDPSKLKDQCMKFNNRFLMNLRRYYSGMGIPHLNGKHHKTFEQQMSDIRANKGQLDQWTHYIDPAKFRQLLLKSERKEKGGRTDELIDSLSMPLIGSAAILRNIDAWTAMVYHMAFPKYTKADIKNICGAFDACQQPGLWTSVRNVVSHASKLLQDSCEWFAGLMQETLHRDADIIFEYTLVQVFGENTALKNLLECTLSDYKKETELIVNEFKRAAANGPEDQSKMLNRYFFEDTINIGLVIAALMNKKEEEFEQVAPENADQDDEKNAYNKRNYDTEFYGQMHGKQVNHPISENSMKYNPEQIRQLSHVFWKNTKQITVRDVVTKFNNNVMTHIKQEQSDRIQNAVQCGVDKQQVKTLIGQLVDKTGIEISKLEKLIKEESTLEMTKPLNDLDTKTIGNMYGLDTETLVKEREDKIKELKKFRQIKRQMLRYIRLLKSGKIDQIDKLNFEIEDDEEEDDDEEPRLNGIH